MGFSGETISILCGFVGVVFFIGSSISAEFKYECLSFCLFVASVVLFFCKAYFGVACIEGFYAFFLPLLGFCFWKRKLKNAEKGYDKKLNITERED